MTTATATRKGRTRRSPEERHALEQEALSRAVGNTSTTNYGPMIRDFAARGIMDVIPRVNVLTYHAWRAKGRQVKRGEHGVKVISFIPIDRKERDPSTGETKTTTSRRPTTATVFHISQTEPAA